MPRYREISLEEYQHTPARELGLLVAAGHVSPVQLVEASLEIAKTAEPALNAYVTFLEQRALKEAAALESEATAGRLRSALHGVPIASKDNLYLEGEPTTKGSRTSSDAPAKTSSPIVERLVNAGTVIIGKTTTPEFGWKGTGISPLTGVSRNPWDTSKNTGGSSAGSAATVATGAVPLATGTDAGGSVRIPASFCGVVGIKPTLSTLPVWPGTVNESLSHAGMFGRYVDDVRVSIELTRGPDPRDPQSYFSVPPRDTPHRPLRVGLVRAPFGIEPSAEVAAAVETAFELIAQSGIAQTEFTDLDEPLPREIFEALWVTGRGIGFEDVFAAHADIMDPGLVRLRSLAAEYSVKDYLDALQARRNFNSRLFGKLDQWDLIITPTMPGTAFEAEREVPIGGETDAKLPWITWTPYTYPFNITGQPSVSIPFNLDVGHLPVGLQIIGPWAHDHRVLTFAQQCETVLDSTNHTRIARL